MKVRIGKSLTLKWMVFPILLATIPLIIAGFSSIVEIYTEDWKRSFITIEGTVLIVGILFSLFLAKKLALPIKRLSKEMEEVAKGNWDAHIEPATKDEVGDLTASFNHMVQALKQSKEALREVEEKYRRIFENSKDMVYVTSQEGKFIDVNPAGVEMLGYENKEELYKIWVRDAYLNPEERKRFRDEIAKEGFVKDFESKLKRKDGTPIDVLITANVRKNDSGDIIGYAGIIKDISVRKKMEEELVQRTVELEILYDMSGLINQSLDLDTVLSTALEKASSLTGFKMGAIYLLNEKGDALEMKSHIGHHPAMVEKVKLLKYGEGVSGNAIRLKQPIMVPISKYPSDRIAPILREEGIQTLVSFPLLAKGKAIGTITLSSHSQPEISPREINLLKSIGSQVGLALENAKLFSIVAKAKSEWETTFDAVTDLVIIRDKDYRVLRVNMATFIRTGLNANDLIRKKCYETFYHRETPCEGCYITEALRTKKNVSGERKSKFLKGMFRFHIFPILDEAGEVGGIVELASDITEEKRLEVEKEVVNHINKILASSLDVSQEMKAVHSEIKLVLDSDRMTVTLLDGRGEGFRYFGLEEGDQTEGVEREEIFPKKGTVLGKVVETGLPVIVQNIAQSDVWIDQRLLLEGMRSSLVFPLEYKGKIFGTFNLGSEETNHFSERHFPFLRQVASALSGSIENSLLLNEIKESEEKYRTVIEGTLDGVCVIGIDYRFKYVNEKLAEIQGYSREELIGTDLRNYLDEESRGVLADRDEQRMKGIKLPPHFEINILRKDGGVRNAEISARSIRDSKRNVNIIVILKDITNRKQAEEALRRSEERYRNILESMQDGYFETDLAGNFTFVNDAGGRNLGYSREELIGMSYRQYTDEKGARELYQTFNGVYRTGEPVKVIDVEIVRKDGAKVFSEISVSLIRDSEGEPIGFRGIDRDVTERKRMEEQLLQAEKLRAVGEMASGVAHDFNNALAAILGNTQLMLHSVKDEEFKESLKTIEKVARGSAQTVRRLQDFTRRKVHQELYKLNVNSIVKDAIEIAKPSWRDEAQSKGMSIEMVSDFEDIAPVAGSASELREVITNMVFNAIEAMPEGGRVEIRTFQRDARDYIQISDTGMGIKEEVRKKIFEPFFTTKPFSNTGLGLSMSYGIIKRMGGEIDVESKVGQGTTFTISLPICFEAMEEEVTAITPSPPPVIKKGKEARILVIDDEESVRSVLSRILTQVKHQVNVAKDGEEGIRLFHEGEFDIVLTDLGMPGMSGWDVCKAIKKISPQTPVGMITGWGMEIGEEKMKEAELDFLISKPFDFKQIVSMVAKTMESKRM